MAAASVLLFCRGILRRLPSRCLPALFCVLLLLTVAHLMRRLRQTATESQHLIPGLHHQDFGGTTEPRIIVYNRVPKTGSTSFVNMVYDICWTNRFHTVHLSTSRNQHVLSLTNQAALVQNLTAWTDMQPMMLHGHLAFLDFHRLGSPLHPLYINIVRDPLERLVSYFYFLRFGDDFRPHLVRKRMRNRRTQQMTFDQCVEEGHKDCSEKSLWLQVPFFCGHDAHCWLPGNRDALEQAKRNLLGHYFLVGITEELGDFLLLLEAALPRFFRGLSAAYASRSKSHLRRTSRKLPPSAATIERLKRTPAWQLEQEFYEFARTQFRFAADRAGLRRREGGAGDATAVAGAQVSISAAAQQREQQWFGFEKIKPRRPFPPSAADGDLATGGDY